MKFLRAFAANRVRLVAAVALGTLVLLGAGDDSARVEKLGHKVICMCGCNQVLLECNHYGCPYLTPEQQELAAAVAKGDTDGGILRAFVEKYGPTVLAAPTTRGFDQLAWIMPYLVLALGVVGVVLVVRNWHKRAPAAEAASGSSSDSPDLDRFREQARKETEL
jgi:cytochrome c-type biogenesis protein CcmH